jgi:hypothetical protein
MHNSRSPLTIAGFALILVALGFVCGLGYQSWQHAQLTPQSDDDDDTASLPVQKAPVVRTLRVSPDDRLLAFTGIYNHTSRAGRFVFDLKTYRWDEAKSPRGWQDSIAQWSHDSRTILWTREKIPRPVDDATPGLHREGIALNGDEVQRDAPEPLLQNAAPPGEEATSGFWTPNGALAAKTRRESRALFFANGKKLTLLDRSPGTYYQNRAVTENGRTVFYVVRDISVEDSTVGLLRIDGKKQTRLGNTLRDLVWAYLSENARWLVVCRYAPTGNDWEWSLYQVTPAALSFVRKANVPSDIVTVYWSPDLKQILGAAGKHLWLIDVPSLQVHQLGSRADWNADDAAWLNHQKAVIVAANGHLWKVDTTSGERREVWKFPAEYWK